MIGLGPAEVRSVLGMELAIEAVETAFRQPTEIPARIGLGDTLIMPGRVGETTGIKLVSTVPGSPNGTVLILHPDGSPRGMVDGPTLTAIRTGAVVGLATKLMAPPNSSTLAMLGAGAMAADQVAAIRAVRPIEQLLVWSRQRERAEQLAQRIGGVAVDTPDQAVAESNIIATATPATVPLFSADAIRPRTHINAIGSFRPDMIEIPPTVTQQSWVVVEDLAAAAQEAGDLIQAGVAPSHTLRQLLSGEVTRPPSTPFTLFKSVGIASLDVAAARACLAAIESQPT